MDQPQEPLAQAGRRHDQLLQPRGIRVAGQGAEKRAGIFRNGLRRGEQSEIRIDAGGALVVVAGPQVDVAAKAMRRPPDDQADLRMDLVAADPVDDVGSDFFERTGPADVPFLVESRGQLEDDGHLLVALGGPLQARDQRRSGARPIQRLFDRQDIGIVGRLRDQRHHRVVRLVGMVEQDVAVIEDRKQIGMFAGDDVDRLMRRIAQLLEAGQLDESHQHAQVDRSLHRIHGLRGHIELSTQGVDQLLRGRGFHFEADDVAAAPAAKLALDQLQVRPATLVVELHFRIARQPDDRSLENRLTRKQL